MSGICRRALAALVTTFAAAALAAAPAGALVAPVSAGPPKPPSLAHLDFDGFFPSSSRIHVGDSVSFAINGFHMRHLPREGAGAAAADHAPRAAMPVFGKLDAAALPSGSTGSPARSSTRPRPSRAAAATYAGKGYLNSGLPGEGPPKPFVVKFTKAGTFTFHCLVHPVMKGVVRVLPKSSVVPSVKADGIVAKSQQRTATLQARRLRQVKPPADTVLAGNDGGTVAWLRFFPESLKVKTGTTVEFKIASSREVHTITFGPVAYTEQIEKTFTTPVPAAGGPPTLLVNPLAGYPSDPPPLPPYTGANHGNGFEGARILSNGGPPLPSSVKITFTKPGVYPFECVIHPNMDGKITVTS